MLLGCIGPFKDLWCEAVLTSDSTHFDKTSELNRGVAAMVFPTIQKDERRPLSHRRPRHRGSQACVIFDVVSPSNCDYITKQILCEVTKV